MARKKFFGYNFNYNTMYLLGHVGNSTLIETYKA